MTSIIITAFTCSLLCYYIRGVQIKQTINGSHSQILIWTILYQALSLLSIGSVLLPPEVMHKLIVFTSSCIGAGVGALVANKFSRPNQC